MTKREFYEAIAKNETLVQEVRDFAEAAITKLDETNEKRRNAVSKKAAENQPLLEQIVNDILGNEPVTASEVAVALEISTQKASYLLRALVEQGKASAQDIKVPKKGKVKGYTIVTE
jgi:predicted HTH transcriptional regulator